MSVKPVYASGDILVLEEFDGRSKNCSFLLVASLTKSGAPRVYTLQQQSEEVYTNGSGSRHIVRPLLTGVKTGPAEAMRWYVSRETFAFEAVYGCGYTSLEKYDPEKVYIDTWLDA